MPIPPGRSYEGQRRPSKQGVAQAYYSKSLAMQGASPSLASYKPTRTLPFKPIRTLFTLSPIPYIRTGRGLMIGTATIFLDRTIWGNAGNPYIYDLTIESLVDTKPSTHMRLDHQYKKSNK